MKNSSIRENIVETASYLFYKKGYNLTGINEIIKEAGIAKATLYNHFRSKEDICIAYLKHKNSTFIKDIKTFSLKTPKGKKQILALFEFLNLFYKDKGFNGCWCIKTAAEIPKDNEKIKTEIQNQKNQFIQLIEFLTASNFPKRSAKENDLLAKQVYLLYESAITEAHVLGEKWPIETAKSLCNKIL